MGSGFTGAFQEPGAGGSSWGRGSWQALGLVEGLGSWELAETT